MQAHNKLTQYAVAWWDAEGRFHDMLLYAKDPKDARKQVGAPESANVTESHLTDLDVARLLSKPGRPR